MLCYVVNHLKQELSLNPPHALMLPRSPLSKKCVDLVDKYDRGLEVPEQQLGAIEDHIMVVVDRHDHYEVKSNWSWNEA